MNCRWSESGRDPGFSSDFFVPTHYLDFLTACLIRAVSISGKPDRRMPSRRNPRYSPVSKCLGCLLSIDRVQETGYLVERLYKAAYGDLRVLDIAAPYSSRCPSFGLTSSGRHAQMPGVIIVIQARINYGEQQASLHREFVLRSRSLPPSRSR